MMRRGVPAALCLAMLAMAGAQAAPIEQPARWIKADDLRVRAGPGKDEAVVGLLQRGTRVVLKDTTSHNGFCLVEGDGRFGYVACQYLSAEPVARPHAGQDGVPADRRWVNGAGVILRAAPRRESDVVSRLALNRPVRLLHGDAGAGYCEVQPLDRAGAAAGPSGFTACQYLGQEALLASEAAGGDVDPVRAFWHAPGWAPLMAYAQSLADALPEQAKGGAGPWPRNEELERMKAHLALGLKGPAPRPLDDWTVLQALAATHAPTLLSQEGRELSWTSKDSNRHQDALRAANQMLTTLRLYGPLHDDFNAGGAQRVANLVLALDLPKVGVSLFRGESDVGPPDETTDQLAGRFGGIYRTTVAPRKPLRDDGAADGAGLYDMASRTATLTRPVQVVRLYRDGTVRSESTNASQTEALWREADEPMCSGWQPGFGFGDVTGPIWRYFNDPGLRPTLLVKHASNSDILFSYYAAQAPSRPKVEPVVRIARLDPSATGFARINEVAYDLDGDGVPDLMVLEGIGRGPGHLGDEPLTDDPWYRLLLANVAGAWKILGRDSFAYGCGC